MITQINAYGLTLNFHKKKSTEMLLKLSKGRIKRQIISFSSVNRLKVSSIKLKNSFSSKEKNRTSRDKIPVSRSFEHHTDDSTIWLVSTPILREDTWGRSGASHLSSPSTNLTRGHAARRLSVVPPCSDGTIHLQTSISSPGFKPRPYGTGASFANYETGWATESRVYESYINIALYSNARAIGDGTRNFEKRSSDKNNTRVLLTTHTIRMGEHLSLIAGLLETTDLHWHQDSNF
ncbi:hypothetical protein TNCV_891411 [Trichonephila clavipes]|nr:hypothetical protein TNCV_891411 [Trichonephila clavipes]